jgi:hypothetical protein
LIVEPEEVGNPSADLALCFAKRYAALKRDSGDVFLIDGHEAVALKQRRCDLVYPEFGCNGAPSMPERIAERW